MTVDAWASLPRTDDPFPAVILLRPKGSANVGSVARAMMNFGMHQLYLVAPRCAINQQSRDMACHAGAILDATTIVGDLSELFPLFHLLIGTSGKLSIPSLGKTLTPREMGHEFAALPPGDRAALLLGPEDQGLTTRELQACHRVVRIPCSSAHPSLNLAQAAGILFFHIYQCQHSTVDVPDETDTSDPSLFPSLDELERMYAQLEHVLLDIGFLHENNPKRMMYALRRILSRARVDRREVHIVRGILSQMAWVTARTGRTFRR